MTEPWRYARRTAHCKDCGMEFDVPVAVPDGHMPRVTVRHQPDDRHEIEVGTHKHNAHIYGWKSVRAWKEGGPPPRCRFCHAEAEESR